MDGRPKGMESQRKDGALSDSANPSPPVLDALQLIRIEAVHRGFLYQHLYAVACLFLAQAAEVSAVIVERDEDIEIALSGRRIYVQVKMRSGLLSESDIESVIRRFDALRGEHGTGERIGAASFVITTNSAPGPALRARMVGDQWPSDASIIWPGHTGATDKAVPAPRPSVTAAFAQCAGLAARLPYALLAPETLAWKLAGAVMGAAAGNPPRADHTFRTAELPMLFEQLVVQQQELPAPPAVYRAHEHEPALDGAARIRIITGYSGSGKTSWVAQVSLHSAASVTYLDVVETPGPALASTVARELAARLFGGMGGALGELLLPGATGPEILTRIGIRLAAGGKQVTVVLDNAHRVPATDLKILLEQSEQFRFILLCQPGKSVRELEALLAVAAIPLQGGP
jgi:hypothetical protein